MGACPFRPQTSRNKIEDPSSIGVRTVYMLTTTQLDDQEFQDH